MTKMKKSAIFFLLSASLKPLRVDSALRALSTPRGLRGYGICAVNFQTTNLPMLKTRRYKRKKYKKVKYFVNGDLSTFRRILPSLAIKSFGNLQYFNFFASLILKLSKLESGKKHHEELYFNKIHGGVSLNL